MNNKLLEKLVRKILKEKYIDLPVDFYVRSKDEINLKEVKELTDNNYISDEYHGDADIVYGSPGLGAHQNLNYIYKLNLTSNSIITLENTDVKVNEYFNTFKLKNNIVSNLPLTDFFKQYEFEKYYTLFVDFIITKYNSILKFKHYFSDSYIYKYFIPKTVLKGLEFITSKFEYDSNLIKDNNISISDEAFKILSKYMSKSGNNIPKNNWVLFNDLSLDKPIKIYRGYSWSIENLHKLTNFNKYPFHLNDTLISTSKLATSWTSNKLIAEGFVEQQFGVILEMTVNPTDVIADTRKINDKQLLRLYSNKQYEIIIKPGKYSCRIEKIVIDKKEVKTGFEGYDPQVWVDIYDSFEKFSKKFIKQNSNNYKKASFETKNKQILGDYAVEHPLLLLTKYNSDAVIDVRFNKENKYEIGFKSWKPKNKWNQILFDNSEKLIKYVNKYSGFEDEVLNWI